MKQDSSGNHQFAGDWAYRGPLPDLGKRSQRRRVDSKLAVARNGLDSEYPAVCSPQAASDRTGVTDVKTRIAIIPGEQRGPIQTASRAYPPACTRAKQIKTA